MTDNQGLSALVQHSMAELHVPGVAVAVLHDGIEETFAFGTTSVDNPLPVDANTLFQIGSITKTFTATLLMRLVEQGKLDLDAPVQGYLPSLRLLDPAVAATVTTRHLLTHTAGWVGDDFTDTGTGDDAVARYVDNMVELPQISRPGELWSYNNASFVLAGRMVEVRMGTTFERAARELVLEPLGMTRSFFFASEVMTHRFAVGHYSPFADNEPNTVLRPWGLARAANPAGGLVSTAPDLLRYARLHLGLGPDGIIDSRTRTAMQSEWAPAGNFAEAVGAAWMLRGQPPQTRVVGHGGSTLGQQALLEFAPGQGVAVAVLTNGSRGGGVHGRISRWVMREYAGIDEPEPTVRHATAADLAEYVGRYEQAMSSIELVAGDGNLVVHVTPKGGFPVKGSPPGPVPPPARLGFWAADRLLGLDPPWIGARAEFVRDTGGRVAWLRIGGRLAARQ
jgi:CubicO group peptidase (beta-lactamase class C family)